MLVLGFKDGENHTSHHILDVDPDIDSPQKIHDTLKKASNGMDFTTIVCISDEEVLAVYVNEEDYDLSEEPEDADESIDDELNTEEELDDLD